MKLKELGLLQTLSEKIPKNFPFNVKVKILRNCELIQSELAHIKKLFELCGEDDKDLIKYIEQEFPNNHLIQFINIDELPDDINELDAEFLEGLFLITI